MLEVRRHTTKWSIGKNSVARNDCFYYFGQLSVNVSFDDTQQDHANRLAFISLVTFFG